MQEKTGLFEAMAQLAPLLGVSALARFIWVGSQVRAGKMPLTRNWQALAAWILLEGAVAVFSALIGAGIAEWQQLGPFATLAVVGLCGWFGPSGLQAIVLTLLNRYGTKGGA